MNLEKVMELWVDTPSKVRLAVFFRRNPGLVDTLEGIAQRLAMSSEELGPQLRDHIQLGILRERNLGDITVYALDQDRAAELERIIVSMVPDRQGESV